MVKRYRIQSPIVGTALVEDARGGLVHYTDYELALAERDQIGVGEPHLFIRGDHPLAAKLAQHWLAMNSACADIPTNECGRLADVADAMKAWSKRKTP